MSAPAVPGRVAACEALRLRRWALGALSGNRMLEQVPPPAMWVLMQSPVAVSHESAVHFRPSLQTFGVLVQAFVIGSHESVVQMFLSSQGFECRHRPVSGS